jgi:hypothetical protein
MSKSTTAHRYNLGGRCAVCGRKIQKCYRTRPLQVRERSLFIGSCQLISDYLLPVFLRQHCAAWDGVAWRKERVLMAKTDPRSEGE